MIVLQLTKVANILKYINASNQHFVHFKLSQSYAQLYLNKKKIMFLLSSPESIFYDNRFSVRVNKYKYWHLTFEYLRQFSESVW